MSEGCTHDCSTCGENCSERKAEDMKLRQNDYSNIKKVIAVVSGKGGVGKSLVTSLLASASQARGFETAVMDADVTGPSIPKAFGIHERAMGSDEGMFPVESKTGIKIMSINLLLEKEDAPVVWRGPVISGVINQFWQEVLWGDVDYMFVDMPPGTGRRSADGIPKSSRRRYYNCHNSAGSCYHDSQKGIQYGKDDECSDNRTRRKYELF